MIAPFPLEQRHRDQLHQSGISDAIIDARGYCSIAPGAISDVRQFISYFANDRKLKRFLHEGALALPLYHLGKEPLYTWVMRPDKPRIEDGKSVKYEYPANTSNILDCLPCYRSALGDPAIPLYFFEGAKKSDACATLYGNAIVCVNENGVFGFRAKNANGGITVLADFEYIAFNGRTVVICPDGDVRYNQHVREATQRLARLLVSRGAAEVLVLELPQGKDHEKVGVDDFIFRLRQEGKTDDEIKRTLDSFLTTLNVIKAHARIPFGIHPDTKAQLFLPAGYDVQNETIVRINGKGGVSSIYNGAILVTATGTNIATNEETATVHWKGKAGAGSITIPRTDMARAHTLTLQLAAHGASIHDQNSKAVAAFLADFIDENAPALVRTRHADKLGLVHDGLVFSDHSIGFPERVVYNGQYRIEVGTDREAYCHALADVFTWGDITTLSLVLAFSLAGPAIARLHPRRNPALYLAGSSGCGKTTAGQFATGVWGDPTRAPFYVPGGKTTRVGYIQTLTHLSGLPLFIDEAHTARKPEELEALAYEFANGLAYLKGTPTGKAGGGEILAGTLLLAGEATAEFKYAGSQKRVLWINSDFWHPLDSEPESAQGAQRATMLEHAWTTGAGILGPKVAEAIWANWPDFTKQVKTFQADPVFAPIPAPWRESLGIAAATWDVLMRLHNQPMSATVWSDLLSEWVNILSNGQQDTDAATFAFEQLKLMLAQANRVYIDQYGDTCDGVTYDTTAKTSLPNPKAVWEERRLMNQLVACRKIDESTWRIPTNTSHFRGRIGNVQLYGTAWVRKGWIVSQCGETTRNNRLSSKESVKCILVEQSQLEAEV